MKPIPKSSRESNRFIACTITAADATQSIAHTITCSEFETALERTALEMVGKLGIAALGLQVVKDQFAFPNAIIKTNAGQEQVVRAIICAMNAANGSRIAKVESTKTSGTIHHVATQPSPRSRLLKRLANATNANVVNTSSTATSAKSKSATKSSKPIQIKKTEA